MGPHDARSTTACGRRSWRVTTLAVRFGPAGEEAEAVREPWIVKSQHRAMRVTSVRRPRLEHRIGFDVGRRRGYAVAVEISW